MTKLQWLLVRLAASAALWLVSANALALPITFVHSASGHAFTGTLDGEPFSVASFEIVAHGDTADRIELVSHAVPLGWSIDHSNAEITLPGYGTLTILSPTRTFVRNDNSIVGFSHAAPDDPFDLFDGPTAGAFSDWDMLAAIGPVSGDGSLFSSNGVVTTAGLLVFDFSEGDVPATFSAVVPEPDLLTPLALIGLVLARRRPT